MVVCNYRHWFPRMAIGSQKHFSRPFARLFPQCNPPPAGLSHYAHQPALKEACHARPQLACAHGVLATLDASKTHRVRSVSRGHRSQASPPRRSLPTLWPELGVSHACQARVRPPAAVGSTSATRFSRAAITTLDVMKRDLRRPLHAIQQLWPRTS